MRILTTNKRERNKEKGEARKEIGGYLLNKQRTSVHLGNHANNLHYLSCISQVHLLEAKKKDTFNNENSEF